MFKKLFGPLTMQWEVIPNCNYNCFHCYNYWRRSDEEVTSHWTLEHGEKVVDQIIASGVNSVTITGGEPLLVFDEIVPHIDRLLKNGLRVSMNTNAALLDEKIANFLGQRGVNILVSLPCVIPQINDKITNCEGSFEATTKGIKMACEHGVYVSTNMVVSKMNQNYVVETARFVKEELGLSRFNATKAGKPINASKEYDEYSMHLEDLRRLIDELIFINHHLGMTIDSLNAYPQCSYVTGESFYLLGAKRRCTAGRTSISIGYDGSVRACARDQHSYGNLSKDTLLECWDRMYDWRDETFLPEKCKECDRKQMCAGACRVEAFALNSSMQADDPCMDVQNVPVRFDYPRNRTINFKDTDQFFFKKELMVQKENFGIRITVNSQSQFITEELYQFVMQYNETVFTKAILMSYFKIESDIADQLLNWLTNSDIAVGL